MTGPLPARIPPRITLQLSLLTFAAFLVGTNGFVIAGLLPDIAVGLGVDTGGVGLAITVYAGVVAVLAPTFATVFARVSRTLLMTVGMALVAAGTTVTVFAGTLPIFILGRALAGIGGAAIVPTAVAAASAMVVPARRGQAIAIVALGFTLSTAIGSPLGTVVAHLGGWQLPLAAVAVLSVASAVAIAMLVHGVPIAPPLSLARRFAVFADLRILVILISTVFTVCGFNVAYIFSSLYTAQATGGSGALLAALLLLYGVGGILGNLVAGRLTDRFGSRRVAGLLMVVHLVALVLMPFAEPGFAALSAVFLVWGLAAFGTGIPVQHRLVEVDPERSAVSLSWYSTALYLGITLAPLVGAVALALVGPAEIPHAAAIAVGVALVVFQAGYLLGRPGPVPSNP